MIHKLILKNFQKHKALTLKLDPHVTTIVGPSDSGKSAIIRALRWATLNQPRGDSFIRDGAGSTRVTVRIDENKITRAKGKKNTYKLNGKTFYAFGAVVPDEISQALNLGELNFQGQHDAPFWFSASAGQVSRELNQIVDLGVIDTTLSNLAGALRKARVEESLILSRYESAKDKKKKLRPALEFQRQFKALEAQQQEGEAQAQRACRLSELVSQAELLRGRLASNSEALGEADDVYRLGEVWKESKEERDTLSKLVQSAAEMREVASIKVPSTKKLDALEKKWWDGESRVNLLTSLVTNAEECGKILKRAEENLKAEHKAFEDQMFSEEICPLCETPYDGCYT